MWSIQFRLNLSSLPYQTNTLIITVASCFTAVAYNMITKALIMCLHYSVSVIKGKESNTWFFLMQIPKIYLIFSNLLLSYSRKEDKIALKIIRIQTSNHWAVSVGDFLSSSLTLMHQRKLWNLPFCRNKLRILWKFLPRSLIYLKRIHLVIMLFIRQGEMLSSLRSFLFFLKFVLTKNSAQI